MSAGFYDDEVAFDRSDDGHNLEKSFPGGLPQGRHPFDGVMGVLPGHSPAVAYRMNVSNVGGYNKKNPFYIYNHRGEKVQLYYEGGKKKLKRVPLPKQDEKVIKKEEALQDPKILFKYLKQQNRYYDDEFKERNRNLLSFEEKKPLNSNY